MEYISFWSFRLGLWHRGDILCWVFEYRSLASDPGFLEPMLCSLDSCCDGGWDFFLICISVATHGFCSMLYAKDDSFLHIIWMMGVKIEVLSRTIYLNDLNPCSVCAINISRKSTLLSCYFSIVNCIDDRIEFMWSRNVWTSSWWGKRMNASSTYLSHIMALVMPFLRSIPEGWGTARPKQCEHNNKDEGNSP